MPKATKDMIDGATARKIKNMSVPELNTYLYAIYLSGYTEGRSDLVREKLAALKSAGAAEGANG